MWEKREMLRREEDMMMDGWLTIEERKERYSFLERTSSLKEEYKKKGFRLITRMDEGGRRKEQGERKREWELER